MSYWNKYKTKNEKKIEQINIDVSLNQVFLDSIDYLFYFIQIKMPILKDLKLEHDITKRYNPYIAYRCFGTTYQ